MSAEFLPTACTLQYTDPATRMVQSLAFYLAFSGATQTKNAVSVGKVGSGTFRTITAEQGIFDDRGFILWFDQVSIPYKSDAFAIVPKG